MDMTGDLAPSRNLIDAERCIAELQRGRAIALTDASENDSSTCSSQSQSVHIVQLVDRMDGQTLKDLMVSNTCQLVISRSRALALDLIIDSSVVCVDLAPDTDVQIVRNWAGLNPGASGINYALANQLGGSLQSDSSETNQPEKRSGDNAQCAKASLNLAHHAHVLPALIMYSAASKPTHILSVNTLDALRYCDQSGELLKLSSTSIPLATADNVELTVFREQHGDAEHVAITVGQPDFSEPVVVRIHSSCFTGDILGSMKCDCGEQLQSAISKMAEDEGGVVLYVSQEGRGIGLSSKLLAYQLQDQGLDTIEANEHLGFEADERRYKAAVFMLEQLGINQVRLMTNNPLKIEALRQQGVEVLSRVPSPATVNVHNVRYLQTKRDRAGHLVNCDALGMNRWSDTIVEPPLETHSRHYNLPNSHPPYSITRSGQAKPGGTAFTLATASAVLLIALTGLSAFTQTHGVVSLLFSLSVWVVMASIVWHAYPDNMDMQALVMLIQ